MPGGKWKGDFLVAELTDFNDISNMKEGNVSIQRVREVYMDSAKGYVFPLKDRHDKLRRELPVHSLEGGDTWNAPT